MSESKAGRPSPSKNVQKISIIVPCYNEEEVLPQLFQRLGAAADTWGVDYEIICVDDGSRDRTWELLSARSEADPRWRCLSFARNFGHQMAVSAGLYHASGEAVIIIDADLQDPPEQITRLINKWREGFEVVFAVRRKRKDPFVKRMLAWGFYRLISRLSPFPIPTDAGDFCLLDRKLVDVLNSLPERNRYLRGLRSWCGFRQAWLSSSAARARPGRRNTRSDVRCGWRSTGCSRFQRRRSNWRRTWDCWFHPSHFSAWCSRFARRYLRNNSRRSGWRRGRDSRRWSSRFYFWAACN